MLSTLFAALAIAAPAEAQLVRSPYLHQGTPNSMTVVWTTGASSESVVKYGSSPTALSQTATGPAGTQHEVKVTGLTPGSRYFYSVGTSTQVWAGADGDHYFDTSPPVGTKSKFRTWIVGDSGTGGSQQAKVRDAMLTHVGAYRPQLYLHMGDMAYSDGTTAEFTSKFFAMYPTVLRNTVIWPTLGNHEGHSSDSGTQTGPYYTAYVLPKAGEAGGLPSGTEAYYSFDYANVHFIVLDSHDSNRSPTGAMLTWAKNDIAATKQEWVVAYFHHPAYTKGSHDSDTEGQLRDMRENALPILEAGGVDLVLAGHSHIYERSFLVDGAYETPTTAAGKLKDPGDGKVDGTGPYQKPAGITARNGAVYIVAGHGGTGVSGPGNHPLMYFTEVQNGSCVLDVQGNRLAVLNIRHDGEVTDRFTMVKGEALVIASPDGGETLQPSQPHTIRWASVGTIPNVNLEYSIDNGQNWTSIASNVPNSGAHVWAVPAVTTTQGLVKVTASAKSAVFDESNAGFNIGNVGPQVAIGFGDEWRYLEAGPDPSASFVDASFDDSSWKTGKAELGYGDGDETTLLTDADPNIPTAYFRKKITLSGLVTDAALKVIHDDGVVVYVNGTEVLKKHVTTTDYASYSGSSQDNELSTAAVPTSAFVSGENTIAALVKQSSAGSSDLSFDLELSVTVQGTSGPDGGVAGSGGSGGSTGSGGASAGNGGSAGNAGSGANASKDSGTDESGCGCKIPATPTSPSAWWLGLIGLGLLRRRRVTGTFSLIP